MHLEKLPDLLHDAVIKEIRHSVDTTEVSMFLSDMKRLIFRGVIIFRSESYFSKATISADALYISCCEIKHESWLIGEGLNPYKPDGGKKWGDEDLENFGFRNGNFIHMNLYCNDWEFDIVCKDIVLE